MARHGWQWQSMASNGQPWPAMASHGRPPEGSKRSSRGRCFVWQAKATKNGPPPGVDASSGILKKSLRSGPKGPLGPLGPLKKSLRSGIHARNPPKWSATPFISCRKNQKWAASPPILGGSGHEIKCVADHLGGFRAWIPERNDFCTITRKATCLSSER